MEGTRLLYLGRGADSLQAEKLLFESNVPYTTIDLGNEVEPDREVPQLVAPEGVFQGLAKIRWYARAYQSVFAEQIHAAT